MGTVTLLRPFPKASTLRAMARARHVEAVECLHANDLEGFLSRLRDVDAFEQRARLAQAWEDEVAASHRATARLLARALEGVERERA